MDVMILDDEHVALKRSDFDLLHTAANAYADLVRRFGPELRELIEERDHDMLMMDGEP